jgi:hypothetical protein
MIVANVAISSTGFSVEQGQQTVTSSEVVYDAVSA